jgi:outer membrane immunogenic protein
MRQFLATLLGATALSAVFIPGAFAATPVAPPAYNWTDFYLGVNAGYGAGRASTSVALNAAEASVITPYNPLPGTLHPNGFIGGGQIGYNHQFGSVVAGLETDLSYAGLRKTDSATGAFFIGGVLTTAIETSSTGSERCGHVSVFSRQAIF